jgi:hypothetical protein
MTATQVLASVRLPQNTAEGLQGFKSALFSGQMLSTGPDGQPTAWTARRVGSVLQFRVARHSPACRSKVASSCRGSFWRKLCLNLNLAIGVEVESKGVGDAKGFVCRQLGVTH